MRDESTAFEAVDYALRFVGRRYQWGEAPGGGDDPVFGFDCSGFVSEVLRGVGVFSPSQRENARGILQIFKKNIMGFPYAGVLAFYGSNPAAPTHIAMLKGPRFVVEAGGGNSKTTTDAVAAARNAFVRIRPLHYRSDLICMVDPFLQGT